ncbi:MAG: glycosyltransferase family 4 protein [Sphingomicrobium sp.]
MKDGSVRGHVLLLSSYAPSLINFRGKLIEGLIARGHKVTAVAPVISKDIGSALEALGAQPREVALASNPLNPIELRASHRAIVRMLRETKPDTVIAYTIQPATIGVLAAAQAGVPNIVPMITGLGYPFSAGKGLKRRLSRLGATLLYRVALEKASTVIFQNSDDRVDLEAAGGYPRGKRSVVVAGSGVDLDAFAVAPLPAAPNFLMLARLIRDKGVFEYAEAAKQVKARYPDARFELAGWIDHSPGAVSEAELAEMVRSGVDYLGQLDDVRPAIAGASIFVLPSAYREGIPRSILEAMAMGRAVITCDTPGCRETVVQGENGFLVPPFDAGALGRAMERFILDPALRRSMGQRSRELAEERFDVRKVNEAIFEAAGL